MSDYASSPARRSNGDLQKILESLMGGRQSVRCQDLPSLLRTYEEKHDIIILDPPDYENVVKQSEAHPDLTLDPENLFQFLSICTQLGRDAPPSPPPHLPHSASLPSAGFRQLQDKTPRPKRPNRRVSDRIRSPSDSSSSSYEGAQPTQRIRQRNERQSSAPPIPFPSSRSQTNLPSLADRPLPPLPGQIRAKTLSDASKNESPLAQRVRNAGKGRPPSSFSFAGTAAGFARPSPASRRRRGSTSGQSASGAEDVKSPDFPPTSFDRSISSGSLSMTSPLMSPASPRSPTGLDHTSFHGALKSPDIMSELGKVEMEIQAMDDVGLLDDTGDEQDEVDALDEIQGIEMDPRLSRISTESSNSLRTSHDKLRQLQKQNTDIARKLKESEKQLAVLGAENERLVEDLQDKLEEARSEITQRRKDEKDWKGKERTLMIQISGFEADISSLQRSLENSKQNHANMQKMYNSQCGEAQRLRDLLIDRDEEIRQHEAAAQTHEADEQKYSSEISALEAEIRRLESDLNTARQAEGYLETQKQENLQLKETIDRMRFDLDEARATASGFAGTGHTRGPTSSSGPATLSRNLGDELHRRLVDAEKIREETVQEDGEEYVETVITTQRTRKMGNKPRAGSSSGGPAAGESSTTTRIEEEEVREYADVGTVTDALTPPSDQPEAGPSKSSAIDEPPAYTREPDALSEKEVLLRHHPRVHETPEEMDEGYAALVGALGMRCGVLEAEMKERGAGVIKASEGQSSALTRSLPRRARAISRSNIVNYVFYKNEQMGTLAFYVGAAMVLGISIGAKMFGAPSGIHPRDYHLFTTMNTLAAGAGVGEGFIPGSKRAWEVARIAAGGLVPS